MNRILLVLLSLFPVFAAASEGAMPSRTAPARAPVARVFRAPNVPAPELISLPALQEKAATTAPQDPNGPLKIATVRELPKAAPLTSWTRIDGGYVLRLTASAADAEGLRVRLDLGAMPGPFEVRVQGTDGNIETMNVDPALGAQAWTPWTPGSVQLVEIFSAWQPKSNAIAIGALLHFTDSPLAKATAGTCTLSTACTATDAALPAGLGDAITQAKKSVMRLQFVDGGSGFLCTGTLINTDKFPAAYLLTANHCINNAQAAATITTLWFYESTACDLATPSGQIQVGGGTQLIFTNYNVDESLLLLNGAVPEGALYAGSDPTHLATATPIVSISHPKGDTSRYAVGAIDNDFRILGRPQDMYGVHFARGIIEGGSSGSGLFVLANGVLQLRGVLTGTTVNNSSTGMSCTDLNEDGLYSRYEIFYPEIQQYITNSSKAADDAPNRVQDFAAVPIDVNGSDKPLNTVGGIVSIDNKHIDYAGDLDLYRFTINAKSWVSAWTEGANGANLDTVGSIVDSRGVNIIANDDANGTSNFAGVTVQLDPGTYYFQVGHWDPAGTGAYNVRLRADQLDDNYTDLWWNPSESGWGINFNHQDNILFGTLFTYDANGAPMWLVMSKGDRLGPGSYQGTLYRTTGSAFNANPFVGATPTEVGTLRVDFSDKNNGRLTYTVNGVTVTKTITRQQFSTPVSCTWSAYDRAFSDNVQDLWYNAKESGWGINITQQGSIAFATLFTYDTNGQGLWLVMSKGDETASGGFTGPLYKLTGPAFNASPWTAVSLQQVGTMTLDFTTGSAGTLTYTFNGVTVTKPIEREVFGQLRTDCGPQDVVGSE